MTATEFNADRLAATTRFAGLKGKHTRAALPDLDDAEFVAVQTARKRIHSLRLTRAARRRDAGDPLIEASANRGARLHNRRELDKLRAAAAREKAEADAIRDTMIAAARVARSMDFTVRASKNRAGRISSYYCRREGCGPIRISDHEIPWTPAREAVAYTMAGEDFHGYHGGQLIIDRKRPATWLRRALTLIAAGRSV